jgi:hypothetical protein
MTVDEELLKAEILTRRYLANRREDEHRLDRRLSKKVPGEVRAVTERMNALDWPGATLERVRTRKFGWHEHWERMRIVQLRGAPFTSWLNYEYDTIAPVWLAENGRLCEINDSLFTPWPKPGIPAFMVCQKDRTFDHAASLLAVLRQLGT